jgi:hypothetical protein
MYVTLSLLLILPRSSFDLHTSEKPYAPVIAAPAGLAIKCQWMCPKPAKSPLFDFFSQPLGLVTPNLHLLPTSIPSAGQPTLC